MERCSVLWAWEIQVRKEATDNERRHVDLSKLLLHGG